MVEHATESDIVESKASSQSSTSANKNPPKRGGEKKEGRRLVDDKTTLVALALQASGAQQEEVDSKLEKLRERDENRPNKPKESELAQRGRALHKSKKLHDMKEQIKSNKGKMPPKVPKEDSSRKSKTSSTRKTVAFQ